MLNAGQRGMSLIELMIGIAIVSILLMAGIPGFNLWIQNSQNRAAAESILNGIQLARTEAVTRNTQVRFEFTDDRGLVAWNVGCVAVTADCPATIQRRTGNDGAANARVGVSTASNPLPATTPITSGTGVDGTISFNGLGRVAGTTDITRIDVTNAGSSNARRYVVVISPGGQIRMCDPALSFATNPQGCS
ncbi:GspH/FimT family pseudopilin [Herbaspirillum sp. GCM10030257]|uniref:GspH/FimT family pseudopilin n=1 Tax=Herbaspirillum sp. GCM10030257 TaxID=3273393 RepID=UPI003622F42D